MILIRKAVPNEKNDLELLLEKVDLNKDIISDYIQNTMVIELEDRMVGCGGLDIHGHIAVIKFVAILPDYQNQGLGDGLVRALVNYADRREIKKIYITDEKPLDYFKRFGFKYLHPNNKDKKTENCSNEFDIINRLEYLMELDVDKFFNNPHCNC